MAAEGLPTGQQPSSVNASLDGPRPRVGPSALLRARVALALALAYAISAAIVAGHWLGAAARNGWFAAARAATATGRAAVDDVRSLRAATAAAVEAHRLRRALRQSERAAARARRLGQPPTLVQRLARAARSIVLSALYHTGVATLRLLAIVGLIALLAVMGSGLALPAVVPGAKLVKANLDRFNRFPPLPDEFATPAVRSTILASDGSVLSWLFDGEIRKTVSIADVPMMVRQAVLAIEDSRFYEHNGVDYRGIARAARANFESGGITQGGSTLTQQYIKLITNEKEATLDRKVQEAQYALELERRLPKDKIFENYLNLAYFGDGVYGIATAAEHFFSKSLEDLTIGEAASLAGTIADPNDYNPLKAKENIRRRNQVLDRMAELRYAPPDEVAAAKKSKLKLKIKNEPNRFGYYHSYISGQLQNDPRFNKVLGPVGSKQRKWMVFSGGLTIKTTLAPRHQRYAQRAVIDQLRAAVEKPKQRLQGALASVNPSTGAVLTIVGGRKFDPNQERGTASVNFAVTGRGAEGASPGSAFKVFFMLAALEQGYSPLTTYNAPSSLHLFRKECPVSEGGWEVGNAEGSARGPINMYEATASSVNTWYAQLAMAVGPSAGIEMARRMGITTIPRKGTPSRKGQAGYADWNVCSAVLGPRNVTPLDMASAYGVLANDGVRCEPFTISEIDGPDGKPIYKHKPKCERVLSQNLARTAVSILQGGPAHGTGTRANFGRPLAGKTGTAQDYTSSYFAGFTPQISTAVWVGYPKPYINNQPNSMLHEFNGGRVFGGTFAALIFKQYMEAAHRGLPVQGFAAPPPPPGVPVPNVTGMSLFDAVQLLRALGFSVRWEPRNATGNAIVVQMSPGPGSRVGRGSVILLQTGTQEPQPGPGDEGQGEGRGGRGRP